jgi:hypothetical protein
MRPRQLALLAFLTWLTLQPACLAHDAATGSGVRLVVKPPTKDRAHGGAWLPVTLYNASPRTYVVDPTFAYYVVTDATLTDVRSGKQLRQDKPGRTICPAMIPAVLTTLAPGQSVAGSVPFWLFDRRYTWPKGPVALRLSYSMDRWRHPSSVIAKFINYKPEEMVPGVIESNVVTLRGSGKHITPVASVRTATPPG